jgi:hypothetical protein
LSWSQLRAATDLALHSTVSLAQPIVHSRSSNGPQAAALVQKVAQYSAQAYSSVSSAQVS